MVLMLRFLNVMFLSQELRIKRRDELNSRYDLADQVLVVGQEKIGTGLRGGSQVDCIRRGKAQHSANACVVIRGFNRKRDDLTNYTPQQALGFVCNLDSANMIRARQNLSKCEGAGNQLVSALFHACADCANALCVLWVVLQPIDEEHSAPV